MRDITQRHHAESERARLQEELAHARTMEAIGTLASGVAHDFSNLLSAIDGYVDLAQQNLPTGHEARQPLAKIDLAIGQARGITRSLLTFARDQPSQKQRLDLSVTLQETMTLLRRLVPDRIELAFDPPADESIWIQADPVQIQRVMMNLTANAQRLMSGSGRVHVTLMREANAALLTVADNGPGMSAQTRARVFEPFFTTQRRGEGTGLGLAVVHGIVQDHGGSIELESEPGNGTRFLIKLPLCEPPTRNDHTGRGEQIVLVQPDPYVRQIMRHALEGSGYQALEAEDALAAQNLLSDHRNARLVVIDADIPSADLITDRLPVVVLGENPQMRSRRDLVRPKPVQTSQLLEAVRRGLRSGNDK